MRKVVIHRAGGLERLKLERHPSPPLRAGEVRIDVEAIGVNYADCVVRRGLYKSARDYVGWPITPGFEVAGVVSEVDDSGSFEVGDEVMAVTRFGGYSTELVVPHQQVFSRPRSWSAEQSAGFPAVHLTADYAMQELVAPAEGCTFLVHSAAGGVGGVLVQMGRRAGGRVLGVVGGPHKVEAVRRLGADAVIDKSSEDLWSAARRFSPDGFDAIFDANGVETLRQSYQHLAPTGRLVVYGFATMLPRSGKRTRLLRLAWDWLRTPRFDPLDLTTRNRSVMGFNLSYLFDHVDLLHRSMARLTAWADGGELVPPKTTSYLLDDVARAHRDLESGTTIGKLVLVVDRSKEEA
jgi:NADPH:quinone reductase-like Zn-dependent oxidoreductase